MRSDNKLFFCIADDAEIDPAIYSWLGSKGCFPK